LARKTRIRAWIYVGASDASRESLSRTDVKRRATRLRLRLGGRVRESGTCQSSVGA